MLDASRPCPWLCEDTSTVAECARFWRCAGLHCKPTVSEHAWMGGCSCVVRDNGSCAHHLMLPTLPACS
jgi:hypothetical protein